nr:reverse transcriptase domain-containing protein [Tanacetum cinerariifolium]
MADNQTMAQLLQAPTEGYEEAIVIPKITANNFELRHGLITLVQNKQFFGHDKEDPHAHIRYFNKITPTMRVPNVPSSSIKLMLFPFSLEGAAQIWLEKEPPRSIPTWDDLVSKFINQFFPPSKTTNHRNEITRFQQRFDESFYEAWEQFNYLLRACPHHGFSELHQLDTFYNALNVNDQDSLNSAAGGNILDKMPRECLKIIESKFKVRQTRAKAVAVKVGTSSSTPAISGDIAELKDMVKALLLDKKPVLSYHSIYHSCSCQSSRVKLFVAKVNSSSSTPAISSDVVELKDMVRALLIDKKNQSSAPATSPTPALVKAVESNCVTCGGTHSYQNCPATSGNVYQDNIHEYVSQAATANYNQGNTGFRPQMVANQIRPPGFPPNVSQTDFERYVKANDAVLRNIQSQGQSTQNQCQNIQNQYQTVQNQLANLTDMMSKFMSSNMDSSSGSGTLPGNTVTNPKEDLKDMSFEISFTDALILMTKFASTLKAFIGNKEKLSEMARTPMNEHCSVVILNKLPKKLRDPGKFLIPCEFPGMDECLTLADLGASINLMPLFVWKELALPELTPTCMTLELADRSVSKPIGIAKEVSVKVGMFHFPADFVVVDFEPDPPSPFNSREVLLKDRSCSD